MLMDPTVRSVPRRLALLALVALTPLVGACSTSKSLVQRIDPRDSLASESKRREPTKEELLATGDQLRQQGDRPMALLKYLRANKLEPEDPRPRERIALLHLYEDPDRAEAIFRSLVAEDPRSIRAHTGLALALLARGAIEDARVAVEKALALNGKDAGALSLAGVIYDKLGLPALAQPTYRLAHEQDPDNYEILNNLGFSYLLEGKLPEALESFEKAARLNPTDVAVQNNLGLVLGRLERYEEALAAFRRGGNEAAAQNNLGYVYQLNGLPDRAREHYERALGLEADAPLHVVHNVRALQP